MALTPLTERQKSMIVNNVINACRDITKLNKTGYKFLHLANGFIAHYDLYGFISYYEDHDLVQDILDNQRSNQWTNFRPGERNYEYQMSKKEVYNRIVTQIC
jgi:hypothetical protein